MAHELEYPMTMSGASLVDTVSVGNTLGESVLWDDQGSRAWWTDIQERRLYRYDPITRVLETFTVPQRLGSFGFIQGSDRIVGAFESGFAYFHPESGSLEWIARPPHGPGKLRFNDGRVDRLGRFWAGTMVEDDGEGTGKLYCLNKGIATVHLTGINICNSVCFSPDGRHLYFADTPHRKILRFDLDPISGALTQRVVFAETPIGAYPDGSNVDVEGHVWNAQWGAARVTRYAPDGSTSGSIEVPASQVTCVAFGGERLDLLFVTSARENLNPEALAREPQAGNVFIYRVATRGIAESRYLD
jgi:L-arabinonolactonase